MRPLTRRRTTHRADPAPSRLAYRMHRLALTPAVRKGFTFGVPILALAVMAGLTFADPERRGAVTAWVDDIKAQIQSREEFMVRLMAVDGASETVSQAIRDTLKVGFPVSSFDLDLPAMQDTVTSLPAVKEASLRIRPGGILDIRVVEREPAFVWRNSDGLRLIDAAGHAVETAEARTDRADLPLLSGIGADAAAPEAVELIKAAAPILPRLRGLVRIGERRWDVVLSDGQKIRLPETRAVSALEQVLAVDEAQDLFARDVVLVDMRTPRRPTVRIAPQAATDLRQVKMTELGDD
ncbi:cell division protein FtsQ/DivIB [Palleronia abyssalis]|uniref:Cell division protein FtsQ n=1 Tax=Palleronia abyssalis TaxID=1501240 RepID=A0A2R8BW50_9RHOB|nr:cell division protein FtsQ/DivIB [Palleronia abyssalis]SPJ24381.1 Cell division protein FtsQ [Palleronia abyssalis]